MCVYCIYSLHFTFELSDEPWALVVLEIIASLILMLIIQVNHEKPPFYSYFVLRIYYLLNTPFALVFNIYPQEMNRKQHERQIK